jgi:kumamolisin
MQSQNAVSLKWTGAFSGSQRRWFTLIAVVFVVATWLPSASAQAGAQTPPLVLDGTAKLVQPANANQMLRIVLGIERPHAAEEEQFLRDLHTKGSKDYRHFLTAEEWNARFGPSKQNEQAVVDWAKSQGLTVTARFPHRLLVAVEGPVKLLQNAFNVTINNYQIGNEVHFSNDRDPQITGSTSGLVHSVTGLNDIQVLQPGSAGTEPIMPIYSPGPVKGAMASGGANGDHKKLLAAMAAKKNRQVTPNLTNNFYDPTDLYGSNAYDFNALYAQGHCCNPFGISGGTPPVTSIAIATAGSQNTNDFAGFQAQYPYLAYHYFTIPINGTPTCCDNEGTLDFEWATAMSNSFGALTNTSSVFMYQGANASLETFTIMFGQILADGHARTMSVSWGCAEISCYDTKTMDTDHGIFNSMSGQGWTLVGIAHDHGATADCSTISVSYPGSDPDMVSAGGTTLSLFNDSTYNNEVAWTGGTAPGSCASPTNNGGGGGGCSAHFGAPAIRATVPPAAPAVAAFPISLSMPPSARTTSTTGP